MITASHNPPADNGYKVYLADGAQMIPPDDALIAEVAGTRLARRPHLAVGSGPPRRPRPDRRDHRRGCAAGRAPARSAFGLLDPTGPRRLRIVDTPLHGVGGEVLRVLPGQAGFGPVSVVAAQAVPDPDFPTVAFPTM